jgi:hypothetical protein
VPVARPARATAKGGRWPGMALVVAMLLLLVVGGVFVIFDLLGFPATPPHGGAVVDATSLPVAPETTRPSVAAERLRATPGLQLNPSGSEIGPRPASSSSEPEAAAGPATAALAAAALVLPAPSLVSRDVVTSPTSEDLPAPAAAAQITAPPASPGTDLAGLAALLELGIPPSVAPPPAASAPLAVTVLPAVGILPAPTRLPPSSGFGLTAPPPPKTAVPSSLEPPVTPPAKVAALPPPDPIGPDRPHDGRGDDAQLLEAALPPPPPPVPAPTTWGDRSPPATRTTLPRPRGATAEVAPRQPASPRCAAILARLQLGETPSHADRSQLHTVCAPRP